MKFFYPNKMISIEADSQEEANTKYELKIKGDSTNLTGKNKKDVSKTNKDTSLDKD